MLNKKLNDEQDEQKKKDLMEQTRKANLKVLFKKKYQIFKYN